MKEFISTLEAIANNDRFQAFVIVLSLFYLLVLLVRFLKYFQK
jgi:hypothetical protein